MPPFSFPALKLSISAHAIAALPGKTGKTVHCDFFGDAEVAVFPRPFTPFLPLERHLDADVVILFTRFLKIGPVEFFHRPQTENPKHFAPENRFYQ
jgi:hypothetical protein